MRWLLSSLILSVILTVVVNLAIRAWPRPVERGAQRIDRWATESQRPTGRDDGRVRVIVPWKAMLVGSLVLTFILNVGLRILR